MKKLFLIVLLLAAAFLVYKYAFKKEEPVGEKPKALSVSAHSEAFNASVSDILSGYYAMTDAFVNWDSAAVNKTARELQLAVDHFKIDELKKDSVIYETALFPVDNSKHSIAAIIGSSGWDEKRRALQELSENLRMLLLTVKYDRSIVYWQECPMAFGEGSIGNWLSAKEEVVNPYLGKKDPKYGATMLNCGETKEKIDFTVADTVPNK
ncbi:DUF3347 domain-containing protein [Niabella aquatica]